MRFPISIPASNDKGQSELISTRVPPELLNLVSRIVGSSSTPWERTAGFVRCAVTYMASEVSEEMADVDGGTLVPPMMVMMRQWEKQAFKFRMLKSLSEMVPEIGDECAYYLEQGATKKLSMCLEDFFKDVMSIRDKFWIETILKKAWEMESFQKGYNNLRKGDNVGDETEEAHKLWSRL